MFPILALIPSSQFFLMVSRATTFASVQCLVAIRLAVPAGGLLICSFDDTPYLVFRTWDVQ